MFTCISCRIAFESPEEQRSHFGTDWHRYNMKRRVANLPPVAASAFNEKVIERREQNAVRPDPKGLACSTCNKQFTTENSYRSHVQSKRHRDRESALARATQLSAPVETQDLDTASNASSSDESMDSDSSEGPDEPDIDDAIAASRRRLHGDDCLFCGNKASDLGSNLRHMSSAHSFFIPDQDILIDLPGLIGYLGEKIAVGNLCIFCPNGGKEFASLEAARQHMVDKGHCKIAYENAEDRAELADYYDYAGDETDEGSDWEDIDDDTNQASQIPSLASDGLSLVLPSGRVLGHRALKVYYNQRLRPDVAAPTDVAKSKVALVRQRLVDPSSALVPVAGGHGGYGKGLEVVKARNAGEAKWARKQGGAFKDQKTRENHKTKIAFRNNNQKHFRDPLLQ